jgi:PucR family transcriptional regulator, purine catabolism regulatory protein
MLTVQDVLQMEIMSGSRVHAARQALPLREVKRVSVIEVPVENFVREHELVLSTAVGCGHDTELFCRFLRDVIHSGASALGVATGPHIASVPEDARTLAEQHDLPLIEIPWETRFSDIIQEIFLQIESRQHRLITLSERVQRDLHQLVLQGKGLASLTSTVQQLLGTSVQFAWDVMNEGSRWLDHSSFAGAIPPLSPHPSLPPQWGWFQNGPEMHAAVPVASGARTRGYLLVKVPEGTGLELFLTEERKVILEHAATACAFCCLRESAVLETELRLQDDFVWSLAQGDFTSADQMASRARVLGLDISLPYVCLIGKLEKNNPLAQMVNEIPPDLSGTIHHAARKLNKRVMTTYQGAERIIFLETDPEQVMEYVHSFLDQVEEELRQHHPGWIISWGIGENQAGVHRFHEGYRDARTAFTLGRRQKGPGRHFTTDTGLYRALHHLAAHDEMKAITRSLLGRLLDYSRRRGIDLIHTFQCYFRNHGNVSQTARELNLHRQSLLYRLRKIESLTGRSLIDADDLFLLQLSIKIWMCEEDGGE